MLILKLFTLNQLLYLWPLFVEGFSGVPAWFQGGGALLAEGVLRVKVLNACMILEHAKHLGFRGKLAILAHHHVEHGSEVDRFFVVRQPISATV